MKRKTEKYKKEKKLQKHTYTCPRGVNKQEKYEKRKGTPETQIYMSQGCKEGRIV
jgi:hypothetical protein